MIRALLAEGAIVAKNVAIAFVYKWSIVCGRSKLRWINIVAMLKALYVKAIVAINKIGINACLGECRFN